MSSEVGLIKNTPKQLELDFGLSHQDVVRAAEGGNRAFEYWKEHGKLPVEK